MDSVGDTLLLVALYGVGPLASIGLPLGILAYNAIKYRKWVKKAAPIVLRMFDEEGEYEELIGFPHEMVVSFLQSAFHVKIITNKPKERPPDNNLLKWLRSSMSRDKIPPRTPAEDLNLQLKDYIPVAARHKPKFNMTELLAQLEDYRR